MERFLWMMAMPPSWAMAMAMRDSETVSMAADTSGMLRRMCRENWVAGVGLVGQHFGIAGNQQHVVEGQALIGQDFFVRVHLLFLCLLPGILKVGADRLGFLFLAPVLDLLVAHRPEQEKKAQDLLVDAVQQRFVHLVAFFFIFDQRVFLGIAAQADAFFQMVDVEQMVLPLGIDDLQHDHPFQFAHLRGADQRFLFPRR